MAVSVSPVTDRMKFVFPADADPAEAAQLGAFLNDALEKGILTADTLTPVALLAMALKETHELSFDKVEAIGRGDLWVGRHHGFKLELEQQKRGQLRVILAISGGKQQSLAEAEALSELTMDRKPWGIVFPVESVEDMVDVIEVLGEGLVEAGLSKLEKAEVRGATFQGTVFERIQERGATMSGKFGALVCRAAGMELTEMIAEWTLDSGRQVDGVELGPDGKPIAIYECQSGIHNGFFLDSLHRDKALGEYLYDPSILPTVRKVVLLAGGYSKEDLRIVKERAAELAARSNSIEVVLLKTVRLENEIAVVREVY